MGTLRRTARDAEGLCLLLQQGRLAAGLTQRQLADRLNVSQSYIRALESGKDVKVLERIFDFVADPAALEKYGLGSQVLSVAVPLLRSSTGGKADRRRNYFAELLPEGESLERLASDLRVPTNDVLRLLAQFGGDVAGAAEIGFFFEGSLVSSSSGSITCISSHTA
jgi:HipA-like protein